MLILTSMYGKLKIVRISLTPKFLPPAVHRKRNHEGGSLQWEAPTGASSGLPPLPRAGKHLRAPPQGVPYEEAVYPR